MTAVGPPADPNLIFLATLVGEVDNHGYVTMFISIIINNYNYGQFLKDSINSCLEQNYDKKEVIVVDDGSQDNSRDIINSFGNLVRPIFKPNGGQGSALNSGFFKSSGDIVIFLDSDDMLLPNCLTAVREIWQPQFSKVHYNLKLIDDRGNWLHENYFSRPLPHGALKHLILNEANYVSSPTSGNAFSRSFLDKIMPIPDADWRKYADVYLFNLAPLFGDVGAIDEPLGCYRFHGQNVSSLITDGAFNIEKCRYSIERDIKTEKLIASFAERLGHKARSGALTKSYPHLQLKMLHDKLASYFNVPRFGSPYLSFVRMSCALSADNLTLLAKMVCIHCYMVFILLTTGWWAHLLTVFGCRNGAILVTKRPKHL